MATRSRAEEFRANAEECERLAKELNSVSARREMLEIAWEWRDLARQVEREDRR